MAHEPAETGDVSMIVCAIRALVLAAALAPTVALAQSTAPDATAHGQPPMSMPMMHGDAHAHMGDAMGGMDGASARPSQAGQGAFAAIQEIVAILMADPATDWSKVDIDALRAHLADMDAVTLHARVARTPVDGGLRFEVTGDGPVAESIRRMVLAHAETMNGFDGWTLSAEPIAGGAALTVRAPAKDAARLNGLGFFGVMTLGMHHAMHHLMIARGLNPHP